MRNAVQAGFETYDASGIKIAIVVSLFNREITENLKQSAILRSEEYKIPSENVSVFEVAGAIEVPLVLQRVARTKKYDAMLAIGCVIKGETPHFEYVCKYVSEGILAVQLQESIPIGFGVLTCNNTQEAVARQQLGGDHLDAALQQLRLISKL